MNTDKIISLKNDFARERANYTFAESILDRFGEGLSDDVSFSPYYYLRIDVTKREDLALLMTVAPIWAKSPDDSGIDYTAMVDGRELHIKAMSAALPGTCKLVEEEYEIPAVEAKPASTGKRMVLKCDNKPMEVAIE